VLVSAMLVLAGASPAGKSSMVWQPLSTTRSSRTAKCAVSSSPSRSTSSANFSGPGPGRSSAQGGNGRSRPAHRTRAYSSEFKEKGYKIPETAIEQQINDIISSDYGGNRAAFVKTLEAEKSPPVAVSRQCVNA